MSQTTLESGIKAQQDAIRKLAKARALLAEAAELLDVAAGAIDEDSADLYTARDTAALIRDEVECLTQNVADIGAE